MQGGQKYYLYIGFNIINSVDEVIDPGHTSSGRDTLNDNELKIVDLEDRDINTQVGESVNEINSFNDALYDDVFIINSLYLETNDPGLYKTTVKTDKDGIARAQIPYGKYKITEKSVSDKYWLNSVPKKIEFSPETGNEFSIENEKKATLTVHHYLENTTEKIVEDQVVQDEVIGESYITMPTKYLGNLQVLSRESNEQEENKIGYNEESQIYAGTYTHDDIEVTYYYGEEKTPLTVHHYIEGTQIPVPLADGTPAPDTIMKGKSGTTYETSPVSNLHSGYELAQTPINANGIYGEEAIELTYYYAPKDFNYTVEYYYSGEKDEIKTETSTAEYGSQVTTYTDKNITGYKFDKTENLPLTITETAENNIIKVYYEKDNFDYTVEYYYDGEKDENKTETNSAEYGSQVTEYTDKNITGYKLDKVEGLPLTISEITENNVIKVYYVLDDESTKTLTYIVEYYKNDEKIEADTQTESQVVQVLESNTMNVDKTKINIANKYVGYKLDETKTGEIPDTVTSGEIIKVYYIRDSFDYTVEYYYDGEKDENKTETNSAEYGSQVTEYTDKNITGYKLDKVEGLPLTITETAENNIIKVYYVLDDENTKTLTYTVEYYKNDEKIEADTQTESQVVQVLESNTMNVDKTKINIENKYVGYKLDETKTGEISDTVTSGEIIKVYYIRDSFDYTVEYYYDGEKDENKTETSTAEYGSQVTEYTDKNITGYKLDKVEGLPLTISETTENNVIKVYYVLDDENTKVLTYKVEYYKDGEIADTETERKVVQILEGNTLEVNMNNINTTDKYSGYVFEKTEPEEIPNMVETGAVIKVYFVRKEAKVVVHHYYKNTTEKIVEDEEIEGKVFDEYTTSPSEGVPSNYKCVSETPDKYTGEMTEEPIEVSYYYEVKKPVVDDTVSKTATTSETKEYELSNGENVEYAVLSEEDGEVIYEIKYFVKIKDYIGKVDIEIVDELPSKIDEEKSVLSNGLYDETNNTISWNETIENVDTFTNGEYETEIVKTIKVVYSGQDLTKDLVNKTKAKIKLYYPEDYPSEDDDLQVEEETEDEVIVKQNYNISVELEKQWNGDEGNERKRPKSIVINVKSEAGDFDKDYVISSENNWSLRIENLKKYNNEGNLEQYNVTEKEVNEGDLKDYDYKETTKETVENNNKITYKYIVKNEYNPVLELDAKMTKTGTNEMDKSNKTMKYTINFKSKAKGDAILTIVDKLPYKIDKEKSDIEDGIYDEDELTITWKEEIKREDDKEYNIDISKNIALVYKDVDLSKAKLGNTVVGKVELKEFKGNGEATARFDSEINVKGKVIVKYINKATGKELEKSKEIIGKVGEEYTTEAIEMEKYKCVSTTGNTKGKIKEGEQEVIYYYELIKEETPIITPTITKEEEQETPVDTVKIVVPDEKIIVDTPKEKAVYTGDIYKKVYVAIVIMSTIFMDSAIIVAYIKDKKMH